MPSTTIRAKGSHASPRPGVPMSERQQMALLMQMTSNEQLAAGFESRADMHAGPSASATAAATAAAAGLKSPSGGPPGPSPRRRRNERGETPLHVAAIKGDEMQVRRLIAERGADPNAKDFAGWTPLHEACNKGWYGVASALLEAGASVNARGYDDITPLHDAAVNGHAKLVRLLVSSGADVTQRNRRGKTPGDEAAPGLDSTLFRHAPVFENAGNSAAEVSDYHAPVDVQRLDDNSNSSTAVPANHEPFDSAAPCEMRRAPLQHKGDSKSGTTRVTLRLHQLKPRDEKRRSSSSTNAVNYYAESMEGKTPDTAAESKVKEEPSAVAPETDKPAVEKPTAEDNANLPEKETTPEPVTAAKKTALEQGSVGAKRSLTESMEGADDGDEESKKKKRRDSDAGKDIARNVGSARPIASAKNASCPDKHTKPVASAKAASLAAPSKSAAAGPAVDRKSPVGSQTSGASPKPAAKTLDAEEEAEEMPLAKVLEAAGGPKVPPLKIVIPQQSGATEQEQGIRNGKNGKTHQALPYVVASSSSNDSVSDKDAGAGAVPSPPDCGGGKGGGEDKKDGLASLTAEERSSHQRVLRSSHRSGGSSSSSSSGNGQPPGGSTANQSASNNAGSNASSPQPGSSNNSVGDRNSNNSSPHQSISQRQSPSPDAAAPVAAAMAVEAPPPALPAAVPTKPASVCVSPPVVEEKMEVVESVAPSVAAPPLPSVPVPTELHPRKRKLKQAKEPQSAAAASTSAAEPSDTAADKPDLHPHDQPITNCYQLFLDIRKQIERRRKGLFPVQPKPPSGFKDYLMNRCTYVLAGNSSSRLSIPMVTPPSSLQGSAMKELFAEQEKERYRLRMQHVIEKEKLVLSVEQEILRVHGRAARALANQSVPFSVCTILKDEEVYNVMTPEQEEKDRNNLARSRYNGRLFISWLQDVDDKWEKIKEAMLLRHHNEAESLHAVQKMDWEWKMKELAICELKAKPVIEELHVPMVHVSDDFDLLPA